MSLSGIPALSRRGLLLGAGVSLAGCGFHPVYATRGGHPSVAQQEMGKIDVNLIPERYGQLLRQALQERLDGAGMASAKQYALSVSYGLSADAISIQPDTTPSRLREQGTAVWSLKKLDPSSTLVAAGTARSLDGLNIIDQQYFAADLEGEAVQRRLAINLANQITLQLASFFARRAPA
jgi:LPS-assembly lipoprotein